jgi:hypothetical protein
LSQMTALKKVNIIETKYTKRNDTRSRSLPNVRKRQ